MKKHFRTTHLKWLTLLVVAALFFSEALAPQDSIRWSFVRLAIVMAPFAVAPFLLRVWLREDEPVPRGRWVAMAILFLLLLAAAFWPFLSFGHRHTFLRDLTGVQRNYLDIGASVILLMVISYTIYVIVRKAFTKRR